MIKRIIALPRVRMVLSGGVSASLAYVAFLLSYYIGLHYQFASVIAFCTYWSCRFLLDRNWAFKSTEKALPQALQHLLLHLSNQIGIMLGLYLLVEQFEFRPEWAQLTMQTLAFLTIFTITPLIFRR